MALLRVFSDKVVAKLESECKEMVDRAGRGAASWEDYKHLTGRILQIRRDIESVMEILATFDESDDDETSKSDER